MTRRPSKQQDTDANRDAAARIARGIQQPGQTKEQTRLIAKGIQKGIEQYRKEQNAKARELDKQRKKARQPPASTGTVALETREAVTGRQQPLPWILLALSWIAMGIYWYFYT